MEQEKDEQLWKIARKRAAFQRHLISYLVINGFLWTLWYLNGGYRFGYGGGIPWPVWPMLGWGIGLVFNYFDAYHGDKDSLAQREYKKLERQRKESGIA